MRCNNKYTTNWWSTHLKAMMEMRCNTHNATHGTTYTYVLSGEDAVQQQIHHYLVQHTPEGHDGDAMQQQIHHNLVQHTPEGHDGDAMQGGLTVEQDDIPIL